jgi:hypothetical protein
MTLAISGHGTILARAKAATPLTFENIAEVGDITAPGLTRNEFEGLTQDRNIDAYVLGVLRRDAMTLALNFLPDDGTHDHLTGLIKALITEPPPVEGYRMTFPGGLAWIMSGQVKGVQPTAPVDGKLSATVTLRFSGLMSIGGVTIGN